MTSSSSASEYDEDGCYLPADTDGDAQNWEYNMEGLKGMNGENGMNWDGSNGYSWSYSYQVGEP
jgi:hypothetical protein